MDEHTTPLSKPAYVEGDPSGLRLLDVNARYMTHEQFARLVENVKADGHLTSTPLVWHRPDTGERIVLSGNHRVKAAVEAGLESIGWLEIADPLPRQRQIALQLSHNAIAGQDDPATLKALYEELEDVSWRTYSGLDDKTLDLLEKVDLSGLNEANLEFATVQIAFLPDEHAAALQSLDDAVKAVAADERWLARMEQYDPMLDAITSVRAAYNVGNFATAFGVVLGVFETHLEDLRDGWLDPEAYLPKHKGRVPLESILGTRVMPGDAAAVLAQAIDRMVGRGDVPHDQKWLALERLAADYLAGE